MRTIVLTAVCACLLQANSGCMLPLGYAYPTVSTTPSIPFGDSPRDFRAFRVDFVESRHASRPDDGDRCTVQELDLSARKDIPSQTSVGFSYWMALYPIPSTGGEQYKGSERSYDKWVHVRVYRRGYKTIEISPSTSEKTLKWELARGDEDREEAIDQLIGIQNNSLRHLEPGSRSPKQEAFLRFAAGEYNDLARSIDEQNLDQIALRTRMFDKAVRLRGLAME